MARHESNTFVECITRLSGGEHEDEAKKVMNNELIYVNIKLNNCTTHAMVDMGVTNNFIINREARRLGLNLETQVKGRL